MRKPLWFAAVVAAVGACTSPRAPTSASPTEAPAPQKGERAVACDGGDDGACVLLAVRISKGEPNVPHAIEVLSTACARGGWWSCGVLASEWAPARIRELLAHATKAAEAQCKQKGDPRACATVTKLSDAEGRARLELQLTDRAPEWTSMAVADWVKACAAPTGKALILSGDVDALTRTIGSCARILDDYAPRLLRMREELARSGARLGDARNDQPADDKEEFRDACRVLQASLSVHDVTGLPETHRQGLIGRPVASSTCEALGVPLKTWYYPVPGDDSR